MTITYTFGGYMGKAETIPHSWRQAAAERLDAMCGLHPPPQGVQISREPLSWWRNRFASPPNPIQMELV